jgi:LCP family protein required for cell wall assembly
MMKKILDFLKSFRMPKLGPFPKIHVPKLGAFPKIRIPTPARAAAGLKRVSAIQIILGGAALLLAIGIFAAVRSFTACWRITELPGIPPASCAGGAVNPLGTPILNAHGTPLADLPPTPDVSVPDVQYAQWDGGSRINIVFFGLRGGESAGEGCPLCTDTIIVFTVDPISKTAGMINVPRDLYVNIPGAANYSRINTAWTFGVASKMPGGGPGEAMRAVSQFLGVPLQYYVQVDFNTFVDAINLLHGIDVYNDQNLLLKKLGGGKDGIRITCCGMRHLGGAAALAYARCRDVSQGCTDGDVGRSIRQQKVILGIRDKVLNPRFFPTFMAEAPQLYQTFSAGIHTDMAFQDAIKLAALVSQIPLESIKQGIIGNNMVNYGNVTLAGQNASVLMPIPDKIRELRDEIFTQGGPTSPIAQGDPKALMQADAARIRLINNSGTPGLDSRTYTYLVAQGMQVVGGGASTGPSNQTVVVVYSPKLYALRYLWQPLRMIGSSAQIVFKPDPSQPVDLDIRLGNDWVSKLPAGY